ncbi:MAG: DUF1638 domain-containing protein [Actinomycetota bacterium]|jgi:hypothetical protein|nr:DUF1638 domain-containing protein [Actinomycetota bacterium]
MTEPRVLFLGCGALAREVNDILALNKTRNVTVEYLPASLHNRPEKIADQLRHRLEEEAVNYDSVVVGYGDCGTGGAIDDVCRDYRVERLPGSHCYEFFLPPGAFERLHSENPATFYLTDYLVKHFDRLVFEALGINQHPELFDLYFGNYERVLYLAQTGDLSLVAAAEAAAERLGLPLTIKETGYGQLGTAMETGTGVAVASPTRQLTRERP